MNCPSCRSTEVRRSRSRGAEKIARYLFARKMYRCWSCGERFGVLALSLPEDASVVAIWAGIVLFLVFLFLSFSGRLFP